MARRTASSDDDETVFATPKWMVPLTKRSRMRMMAYKSCETSGDADNMEAFARPAVKVPASAMIPVDELRRMQAGLQRVREDVAREATADDETEAFMNPTITTQPGAKNPIDDVERSTTSSPSSPQPEGCPLTLPEDYGSDSTDDEMPVLFVLPDTTVIVSPHDTPAVFKPRTPNEDMTQEVCDVILEEVIGRKITLERQNSRLSLERATHNVCQDVAVTITSPNWQKGVRRHLRLESK